MAFGVMSGVFGLEMRDCRLFGEEVLKSAVG